MVRKFVYRRTRQSFDTPGEAHHLTFSCYKRRAFLSRARTRLYFVHALRLARKKHAVHIWAYVIMPTHVHVLVFSTRDKVTVDEFEGTVKLPVSRKALSYLRKNNPSGMKLLATGQVHTPYRFWLDGGGYDQNVVALDAVRNMTDYIHNNPVRAGLCEYAEDWKWSSAQEWEKEGSGILPLDRDTYPY